MHYKNHQLILMAGLYLGDSHAAPLLLYEASVFSPCCFIINCEPVYLWHQHASLGIRSQGDSSSVNTRCFDVHLKLPPAIVNVFYTKKETDV